MLRGVYFYSDGGFLGISSADVNAAADADALSRSEYNPRCILVEMDWVDSNQVLHTQYISNLGYTTGPDDTPDNTCYIDFAIQAPTVSARIDSQMQIGQLTIRNPMAMEANPAGIVILFDWYQRAWRGHDVRLFVGSPSSIREDFSQFFNGTIESLSMDGDGTVTFSLSDKGLLLKENVTKDYGFYGKVFNFEPVYIGNGESDTYQLDSICRTENLYFYPTYFSAVGGLFVTSNGVFQIIEVRDNGSPVTFAASENNTKIELDIPPAGTITVDAIKSENYSAGTVIRYIAADAGIAGDAIDTVLLDQAALGVGYVITQNQVINYMDILQDIAKSAGGYLQWSWTGKLEFYFIDIAKPSLLSIGIDDMTFDGVQIESVDDPVSFLQIGYKRNWKVQDYNGLAGIAQLDASPFIVEYQYLKHDSGSTFEYPIPMQVNVDTLIQDQQDAQIEFQRRLTQRGNKAVNYSLKSFNLLTQLKLGSNVTISYPKFGINNLVCAIIGIDLDPNSNLTGLSLWSYIPGVDLAIAVDFVGVPLSGPAQLAVQFTDKTPDWIMITSWEWDFDNSGTTDSTQKNPLHIYAVSGTYTVKLTVTNDYGTIASKTKVDYITVIPLVVNFAGSPLSGDAPLSVSFTDTTDSQFTLTSWEWDFDNSGTTDSTQHNPSYTYTSAGVYSVKMTGHSNGDTDSETKVNYITVNTPAPSDTQLLAFDDWYVWLVNHKSYKPNRDWEENSSAGTLHCPNLYALGTGADGAYIACSMYDYKTTALPFLTDTRTVNITYHTTGPTPSFHVINNQVVGLANSTAGETKYAHFNLAANTQTFIFQSWAHKQGSDDYGNGEIFIERVGIQIRNWAAAGESLDQVYYP